MGGWGVGNQLGRPLRGTWEGGSISCPGRMCQPSPTAGRPFAASGVPGSPSPAVGLSFGALLVPAHRGSPAGHFGSFFFPGEKRLPDGSQRKAGSKTSFACMSLSLPRPPPRRHWHGIRGCLCQLAGPSALQRTGTIRCQHPRGGACTKLGDWGGTCIREFSAPAPQEEGERGGFSKDPRLKGEKGEPNSSNLGPGGGVPKKAEKSSPPAKTKKHLMAFQISFQLLGGEGGIRLTSDENHHPKNPPKRENMWSGWRTLTAFLDLERSRT